MHHGQKHFGHSEPNWFMNRSGPKTDPCGSPSEAQMELKAKPSHTGI